MMEETNDEIQLDQYMNFIVNNIHYWAFADYYGTLFTRYCELLRRMHNVESSSNTLINDYVRFYENIKQVLLDGNYVHITVGKHAIVKLYYCHRPVAKIQFGGHILLFGKVAFTKGLFHETLGETFPINSKSHVYLKQKTFRIRISATSHLIFIQNENLFAKHIETFSNINLKRLNSIDQDISECYKDIRTMRSSFEDHEMMQSVVDE